MSQVSPPLRIALIAAVAFAGIWALFLRPQPEPPVIQDPAAVETVATPAASSSAAAPATADPSAAAAAAANANASVAAAEAQAGELTGETPVTSAVPPAAGSASPVAPEVELNRQALAKLPADVARAVKRDKVLVILFWNSGAPEDRRVRRALREANTHGGRVFVRVAPVSDIARYAPITRGVDVAQSPTIVVVDQDLHAESLVGYVARTTIRQALSDAVRAGA